MVKKTSDVTYLKMKMKEDKFQQYILNNGRQVFIIEIARHKLPNSAILV